MRAIKHVLTERFYTWEDAVKLAQDDPEVDLSGEGTPFTPIEYFEEEGLERIPEEEQLTEEERKALDEAPEHDVGDREKTKTAAEVDPSTIAASKTNPESPRA